MESFRITKDQLGREVKVPLNPRRIISTVPSQTELLYELGAAAQLIGLTWFCIHPEHVRKEKVRVGGTKNLDLEKIRSLKPDLIIANKEENERVQVEALEKEFPVWISDIHDLDTALSMIGMVGQLVGKDKEAAIIAESIRKAFDSLLQAPPLKTLYLIWRKPYMSIGSDTFIHNMLESIGLRNVCSGQRRYPELTEEDIQGSAPELVLLSSEPYPFKEKHKEELKNLLPGAKVLLVDGEMFSWYGSRLLKAAGYLKDFAEGLR